MVRPKFLAQFFIILIIAATFLIAVQAQSVVFVSAKTGIDGNPCTVAAPCRNLAFAHNTVLSNGRIIVTDSGEYSALVISKSVTIEAAPGVSAVVTQTGLGSTISVNANGADNVVLRGLHLKNTTTNNTFGISLFTGNSLLIDRCTVEGFPNAGINAPSPGILSIQNSSIRNNQAGVIVSPTAGLLSATIENCLIEKNSFNGITASPASNAFLRLDIRNTRIANTTGAALNAICGVSNSTIEAVAEGIVVVGNTIGIHAERNGTTLRVSNSTIVGNSIGVEFVNIANVFTRGNNTLEGNNTGNTFSEVYSAI